MIDHFWVPSGDKKRPWVYLTVPRTPTSALLPDKQSPGRIRAEGPANEALAAEALALLVSRGPDTFAITRGRLNGRSAPGGIAWLGHQDALSVVLPDGSSEGAGDELTVFACTDGLVEVFEYQPPQAQTAPALCAVCGVPLNPGDKVRRACPGSGASCGLLIHEECSSSRCPACGQEIADPTGRSTIWMPGDPASPPLRGESPSSATGDS